MYLTFSFDDYIVDKYLFKLEYLYLWGVKISYKGV